MGVLTYSDPLFDAKGAGRYLGGDASPLSERTLEKWRLAGTGPTFIRLGRCVRYRKSALDDFLKAGERSSTSDMGEAAA